MSNKNRKLEKKYVKYKDTRLPGKLYRSVFKSAEQAKLFLLTHQGGRWEFLSGTTGKSLLSWWESDQKWLAVTDERGQSRSPFGALQAAIRIDKQLIKAPLHAQSGERTDPA